jgi:oxygen-independent coproporphyrinogen-3 oxidase
MLSLYIHIPFCVSKCRYCGFYSTQYDNATADQYLADLQIEIENRAALFERRTCSSIYIGGGTPTALSREQLSRLFTLINGRLRIGPDAEITIEANPNTVRSKNLSHLRTQGVTRLSLGVQSFSDELLLVLGRSHSALQAIAAIVEARDAGFDNIGIDLIFGIPGQTEQLWRKTLETAVSLRPEHIAAYSLSLDDGSRLAREVAAGKISLPNDDVVAGMYEMARENLRDAGYHQYEVSNFSLAGRQCRHNVNYWDRGEYLGLGPGAWSFIGNRRSANIADVAEYSKRLRLGIATVDQEEVVNRDQAAWETLMLGLRKTTGFDLGRYGMLAGQRSLEILQDRIRELVGAGLFRIENGRLGLTAKGALLSNEALIRILP